MNHEVIQIILRMLYNEQGCFNIYLDLDNEYAFRNFFLHSSKGVYRVMRSNRYTWKNGK